VKTKGPSIPTTGDQSCTTNLEGPINSELRTISSDKQWFISDEIVTWFGRTRMALLYGIETL